MKIWKYKDKINKRHYDEIKIKLGNEDKIEK